MKKKNILFIIDSLGSGGAQRQMTLLAKHIDQTKFDISILIYHDSRHYEKELIDANIPVHYIQKNGYIDLVFFYSLIRKIIEVKPCIILSYLMVPNVWARLAGRLAGVKHIITSERNIDIGHSKTRVLIEKLLNRFSSSIVVNAEAIKESLIRTVGIPESKLQVIYNGVDVAQFSCPDADVIENYRNEFGLSATNKIIFLPGRMQPQKNHISLVRAFCKVADNMPNGKLLFAGEEIDQNIKDEIVKELSTHDLLGRAVFAGRQSNMSELYSLSDIVVLPSLWEGFPNVILEAMASERAVIATDIADNKRLVHDGVNGYLFAVNDDQKLSDLILTVLEHDDSLIEMGKKGREIINESFSISEMVKNYQNLFLSFDENKKTGEGCMKL